MKRLMLVDSFDSQTYRPLPVIQFKDKKKKCCKKFKKGKRCKKCPANKN